MLSGDDGDGEALSEGVLASYVCRSHGRSGCGMCPPTPVTIISSFLIRPRLSLGWPDSIFGLKLPIFCRLPEPSFLSLQSMLPFGTRQEAWPLEHRCPELWNLYAWVFMTLCLSVKHFEEEDQSHRTLQSLM